MIEPTPAQNQISKQVVDAAFAVHSALGPGLLETVYEQCLRHELEMRGLDVRCQVPLPITYRNVQIEAGFRIDMIVGDSVVIEIKAVEKVLPVHEAQLHTYLKLSGHTLGFLINFNVPLIRDGLRRRVLSC